MDNAVEAGDAIKSVVSEVAENLYDLNSKISLYFIGMKKIPTEEHMIDINKRIGEAIKKLREATENGIHTR